MPCLDDNTLAELAVGQLDERQRERVLVHLDGCADCRELVASMAPATAKPPVDPAEEVTRLQPIAMEGNGDASAKTTRLAGAAAADGSGVELLATGELVDHFRVLGVLGRGGMGEVYRAHDQTLARLVALKVVLPGQLDDATTRGRFLREARAMARLNHPNIVQVHAVGEHRGMAYVAMEYVEGRSLRARIGNGGIDLETSLRVAADIASALAEAHRRGVVHRDLKPENVMVSNDGGRVRVLDFGLARLSTPEDPSSYAETIPGTDTLSHNETGIAGTPLYMAPEQWVGAGTNTATDVWALGIIIYEMVTGQVPFVAGNEIELSQLVLAAPTPPAHPALPPEIAALVWRCLASQPSARPSAAAVIAELDRIRTNMRAPTPQQVVPATPMTATPAPVVIAAQPPLPAAPPQPRAATSRRWLIAGAAACGAAGMLLAWATRGPTTSEQARRTALDLSSAAVQAATTLAATASAELVQPPPAPDPTPPSSASSRTTVRPETPPRTSTATRIARPPSAPRTGAVPNQPPPSAGF